MTDNGYGVSYIVIGEDQGEQLLKVVSYRLSGTGYITKHSATVLL